MQADYDAAVAAQRRERQTEADYYEQMALAEAAEQTGRDADAVTDGLYEQRRARENENEQARHDLKRGD